MHKLRAVLAAVGLVGACSAGATTSGSIDPSSLQAAGCFGQVACTVDNAQLTATGGMIEKKTLNGGVGFGVGGGAAGGEIDIGEALKVDFGQPRAVIAIKFLFLYNGPEFGDRSEKASVTVDGTTYTLSVRGTSDNTGADWTGSGTVSKCGATTASGTGCFLIVDPFPGTASLLEFKAIPGGAPFKGAGTGESDYALGFIDVAPLRVVELQDCVGETGCVVSSTDGQLGFGFNSMQSANPGGGGTEALVIPVQFPDCRYVPQACLDLLPPAGDSAASDDARREILIGLGVIKPLDPNAADKLNPATQLLNVTPLLPVEVSSLFDASGTPPAGLPPLHIGSRWRGQAGNDFRIDGLFFKTDTGVVFNDVFGGLVDVSVLTGDELGCEAVPGNLLAWDVITTVSELAKSVGGRYADTPVNVGCINPTKVAGSRLSLYSVNLEVVPDTWAPTVKSSKPKVTVNNDAVFARMVQSLWRDIGEVRAQYACKQADPLPAGGTAPLTTSQCKKLASLWALANLKVDLCVNASFYPLTGFAYGICEFARGISDQFEAALPGAATGPDPFNRLGELRARVEVFQHVWDERFLKSLKPGGFCREKGSCPP